MLIRKFFIYNSIFFCEKTFEEIYFQDFDYYMTSKNHENHHENHELYRNLI